LHRFVCSLIVLLSAAGASAQVQQPVDSTQTQQPVANSQTSKSTPPSHPVNYFIYERARAVAWQWFAAPPYDSSYRFGESLLRFGASQDLAHWDWKLEATQATIIDAPIHSVSPVTAQGQLGLGGTYYASNGNNPFPAALFLKQGYARYDFDKTDKNFRLGRFEFFDGAETKPKNATIAYLQTNRVAQRLLGNFSFTVAQRSFDGVDAHYGQGSWDITGMAARSDQGVFNMNGNPELNVDVQYLAYTKSDFSDRFVWRVFGIGYHDGRTGITKTDNRTPANRATDHQNIRIGTYGVDFLTAVPAGPGQFDLLGWGALQNGQWGFLNQHSGAYTVEGGYQLTHAPSTPWLRGGWWRSTGDNNPNDNKHGTFVELLPTPRGYARFPIYNLMNLEDGFVQIIDRPTPKWELRSDLHWLQLTSPHDLWYQGGGAFDNKVFGFTGRPSNGHSSFLTLEDISSDWHAKPYLDLNAYYAHAVGKTVIGSIYPTNRRGQMGYLELVFHWNSGQPHP
jgi:Alginate export